MNPNERKYLNRRQHTSLLQNSNHTTFGTVEEQRRRARGVYDTT